MEARTLGQAFALLFLASACGTSGVCKTDADCNEFGVICYAGKNPKKGAKGICTEGERSASGEVVAAVRSWKLMASNTGEAAVVPLRWDKRDDQGFVEEDNPGAGWVGPGEVAVEAELIGLKPSDSLRVWTGHGLEADCTLQGPVAGARGELWSCVFEGGWNSEKSGGEATETAEAVELRLKPGALAEERSRTYRADLQPPLLSMLVFSGNKCRVGADSCGAQATCLGLGGSQHVGVCSNSLSTTVPGPGAKIHVCAEARDAQSGMQSFESRTPPEAKPDIAGNPLNMRWQQEGDSGSPWISCWTGNVPVGHSSIDTAFFTLDAKARDQAGNLRDAMSYGSLNRISCGTQVPGLSTHAVKTPLAYGGGRLLFGSSAGEGAPATDNALYFFNPTSCELDAYLHTGALQGPMVVLGTSRHLALALGGGGPGERPGQRLALVNMAGASSGFVGESSSDCVAGAGGSEPGAVFDKGLTLLSHGNRAGSIDWRLAAPANSATKHASRLMVYAPHAAKPEGRCTSEKIEAPDEQLNSRFTLTPAQYIFKYEDADNELHHDHVIRTVQEAERMLLTDWLFLETPGGLHPGRSTGFNKSAPKNPTSMALGPRETWLSGNDFTGVFAVGKVLETRTSPAVIDSQYRAYVVVQTRANDHEIQRFSTHCFVGDSSCAMSAGEKCVGTHGETAVGMPGICQMSSTAPLSEVPVGSPLLGEAANDKGAEIYVVGIHGTVLALDAETLFPLWMQSLGIRILPTAQPVLTGNTLWVVAANGEVRGVRVDNSGLNRTAEWPKAFHDNCNTSSNSVRPKSTTQEFFQMPECFN